jgi:hypothetical protein
MLPNPALLVWSFQIAVKSVRGYWDVIHVERIGIKNARVMLWSVARSSSDMLRFHSKESEGKEALYLVSKSTGHIGAAKYFWRKASNSLAVVSW